jgi:hypothetical protein
LGIKIFGGILSSFDVEATLAQEAIESARAHCQLECSCCITKNRRVRCELAEQKSYESRVTRLSHSSTRINQRQSLPTDREELFRNKEIFPISSARPNFFS